MCDGYFGLQKHLRLVHSITKYTVSTKLFITITPLVPLIWFDGTTFTVKTASRVSYRDLTGRFFLDIAVPHFLLAGDSTITGTGQ